MSDITFDMQTNSTKVHQNNAEPWRVTLVDTGENTMTSVRLKRVADYLRNEEPLCFTYQDGVSDLDIGELVRFHREMRVMATVTAKFPPGHFGALRFEGDRVVSFQEKPAGDGAMINGEFFVLSPKVTDLLDGDSTVWEYGTIEHLASTGQLAAFCHTGF